MNHKIARYHFAMSRETFSAKRKSGHFNGFYRDLSIKNVPATSERFLPMLKLIGGPWGWDNKEMNRDKEKLNKRLSQSETKLYYLLDGVSIIGYALITKPSHKTMQVVKDSFPPNSNIIEIENLGLFPGQEGGGRGGKYFEMFFEKLLAHYTHVYWSMSSTNYETLFNYYKNKLGMTHILTDYVDDFRPDTADQQKVA